MNILMTGMSAVLCIAMLGAALLAIRVKGDDSLPLSILAAGLVSLFASVLFLILAAPDVAMTEAAIGSGLTTFLFFFLLARIRGTAQTVDKNDGSAFDGRDYD